MKAEKDPDKYLEKEFRDRITGFRGVCTVVQYHVSGCVQLALTPRVDESGKLGDAYYFDDERLVEVETERPAALQSGRGSTTARQQPIRRA